MELRELYERHKRRIGRDELTYAEKQQAFLNAVLEQKPIEPFVFILADTQEKKDMLVRNLREAIRRIDEREEDTL